MTLAIRSPELDPEGVRDLSRMYLEERLEVEKALRGHDQTQIGHHEAWVQLSRRGKHPPSHRSQLREGCDPPKRSAGVGSLVHGKETVH